jgi:hypothetical protein
VVSLFAYQVMVATVRCEEIANKMLERLNSDKVVCFVLLFSVELLSELVSLGSGSGKLISYRFGWH